MTLSTGPSGPFVEPRVVRKQYAMEMAVERTRLLYQGSLLPTLFMLLNGLVCAWLLWSPERYWLVSVWMVWLLALVALRVIQVAAFDSAIPSRQAQPVWRRMFLLGSAVSGLTLACAGIALMPTDNFLQQAWVFGLIGAAILSASVAYAVSLPAFLSFTLPCLLPAIGYLFWGGDEQQRGWGWLGLILLVSLSVVAWQVNRLIQMGLLRRFQNQALIEHLQQAQSRSEQLNSELLREVEQRRRAEEELREAQVGLESRVAQRSLELDAANQALSKSEARLALALKASQLGLWDWNLQTDEVHHSHIKELFGLEPEFVRAMLSHLKPLLHPEDLPLLKRALVEHLKGRTEDYLVEYRVRHGDGHWVWIEDRGRAVERGPGGRVLRMVGTRRDISASKQQEEQRRLSAMVFEAASEGIVILDPDYMLLAANQAFSRVTGYQIEDMLGRNVVDLPCSRDARRHYPVIHQALEQHGSWQGELVEARKTGELYPQWLQLNVVRDTRGNISHIVGFFADLSARRESEERMRYLTHYDELTGLANRSLFRERLREAHQRMRQGGRSLALVHINLDRFKLLNDSLGHDVADQLLQKMARRLVNALPEADTIARLSGDEFAVLFDAYGSLSSLTRVATRLSAKLRLPITVEGHELVVSASMGISMLPDSAREIPALISQANIAMQHAKHLGGNNFQFYTASLQASTLERLQLENQLRKAVEERQLKVFYQPKLCLATGRLNAAEALVRWDHPDLGRVPPGDFIGLAEEIGLIGPIGEFVLRQACWQACEWQRQGLPAIRVSVNLSVHQLRQGKLVSLVRSVLEETGLAPHFLELELTESHLLDSVEHIVSTFQQLRDLGVKLAIDDFGTGYSSLSYLKRIPVDYVKIDQAFIRGLSEGGADAAITRAIIAMAHGLSLKVVAEGVEHPGQLAFLKEQKCDEVQGYLISRPVEAEGLAGLLRAETL
ncbi:PAS domain S-box-containing protein/diguanylate cyclase (GGDEF) domain-containing protein [Pseudomonas chlororaphis]|uniref:putative bifunctional diguanylate cyclase/phosphodiesterase n=1 Tax=Pseudomonas chlororaphis TaxID=587753 RepID=UPI00087B8965|nr:EAL domain-containing protein [Pseudomonas chlororaphis]AZD70313.1 Sensory box/GGDEF family protein [Pseudomonas chlororaphis subsp. aurantiaca]QIT26107.1 EAL domain-containing protein [Pseudomonas chlororaphis subsp. aurantiaca]WDH04215.1 EAL domain-containing protein [Pseudomonas chlororaphis]WDH13030.1 EAL domain-containing protein [Pseudomonas chlororaphis]SDR86035.1 PAS domain S-box-containing protein/diguanylate cyclase (GGDEF) domain-containing protein [Pseudomonas chlororaphis]